MTPAHFIFIPTVFLVGFLLGRQTADQSSSLRKRVRPMAISFLIVMLVFIVTHIFPYFGGVKSITLVTGGLKILDSAPTFLADEVYRRIEAFGSIGREMYQRFTYTSDVIFPVSVLAFLFSLVRFVLKIHSGSGRIAQILFALPAVWFLSDMIENLIVYLVLDSFPLPLRIAGVLGYVTVTKFILLGLSILNPLVVGVYFQNKRV
jgi:hypothetical protein